MAARLSVGELVDLGDLDELLRRVDDFCDGGSWDALLDLRNRCRVAYERGRQLWPAASHAEYRLALHAPGRWAAAVVEPGAGRFALGPLSEVAASTHTWDDLAPHLDGGPESALVAQERVVRGEDLRGRARVEELPLVLADWEPDYPVATYEPYRATFGDVGPPPAWEAVVAPAGGGRLPDDDGVRALVELAGAWTRQSNGAAAAARVDGDVLDALGALGLREAKLAEVDLGGALALMAWTAASGGAHGRRRGLAQGRFAAWWAAAALAGDLDDWPAPDGFAGVRWYRWERPELSTGWALRMAAEHPQTGEAWAVEATDRKD